MDELNSYGIRVRYLLFPRAGVDSVSYEKAVSIWCSDDRQDEQHQALLEAFGLFGPPAILFFGRDGQERSPYRVVGFMRAEPFRIHVTAALDESIDTRAKRTRGPDET